jgi:hypothetical protein
MKNMNPPPPAPETLPPIAPASMAVLYMRSIMGLDILLEKSFLYCHEVCRSSPASVMSPFSTALAMSSAIFLEASRAFSLEPFSYAFTWESMTSADSRDFPV